MTPLFHEQQLVPDCEEACYYLILFQESDGRRHTLASFALPPPSFESFSTTEEGVRESRSETRDLSVTSVPQTERENENEEQKKMKMITAAHS